MSKKIEFGQPKSTQSIPKQTKRMEAINTDCPICCETFNKSTLTKVTCEFGDCNFEACKSCTRTYILNTTQDPHCMNCKKTWSNDFVVDKLNSSWIQKEYKEHRKKLLLDREMSKIPDTIPMAERAMVCREIAQDREKIREERLKLNPMIRQLSEKEGQCNRRIRDVQNHKDDGNQRRKFIMPCQNDDCRGFISNSYKCDLCKMFTCPKCHELLGPEKDANHVCNEENVKSVEAIRENTKPCPKCGTRIQKIDGCDQMWCPQDNTAFSWRTGQIDTGHVHNPHYYEYQRRVNNGQIPRNPGDNPCNQICSRQELHRVTNNITNMLESKKSKMKNDEPNRIIAEELIQKIVLLRSWVGLLWWIVQQTIRNRQYNGRETINNFERDLTRIRVQYINKDISKEDMAKQILKADKARAKAQAKIQIYDLIMEVSKEQFNTLADARSEKSLTKLTKAVCDFCKNIQSILQYFNEEMRKISVTHKGSVEQIISVDIKQAPRNIYISSEKFTKKTLSLPNTIVREQLNEYCAEFYKKIQSLP